MKAGLMLAVNPQAKREAKDFYATAPILIDRSLPFFDELGLSKGSRVWEPACGAGHLSKRLADRGFDVYSSDLIDRGYGFQEDFLSSKKTYGRTIVTNPPFKLAEKFVRHANEIMENGSKALFFLKIQFLETEKRAEMFRECGLRYIGVMSNRICCAMNGEFDKYFKYDDKVGCWKGNTQLFAWYVFEKGYVGDAVLRWIK